MRRAMRRPRSGSLTTMRDGTQTGETASPTSPSESPYNEFRRYFHRHCENGLDLEGNLQKYISHEHLKRFWTRARISVLLKSTLRRPFSLSAEKIQKRHLIPLSILVFISSWESDLDSIAAFVEDSDIDDDNFPLAEKPPKLPEHLWQQVLATQWQFSPLTLGLGNCFNKKLDARCIFPGVESPQLHLSTASRAHAGPDMAELKCIELGSSKAEDLGKYVSNP